MKITNVWGDIFAGVILILVVISMTYAINAHGNETVSDFIWSVCASDEKTDEEILECAEPINNCILSKSLKPTDQDLIDCVKEQRDVSEI